MSKTTRALAALSAAAVVLLIAAWYDSTLLRDAVRQAQANFDVGSVAPLLVLGSLLVAGAVLLLGALAWRSQSPVVSVAYIVVGAFFTALPWLVLSLSSSRNDAPAVLVLPDPLASALTSAWYSTAGELNAVGTIAAGMLISRIAALVPWWRGRAIAAGNGEAAVAAADPLIP
jgi:hypothetical protein